MQCADALGRRVLERKSEITSIKAAVGSATRSGGGLGLDPTEFKFMAAADGRGDALA